MQRTLQIRLPLVPIRLLIGREHKGHVRIRIFSRDKEHGSIGSLYFRIEKYFDGCLSCVSMCYACVRHKGTTHNGFTGV